MAKYKKQNLLQMWDLDENRTFSLKYQCIFWALHNSSSQKK